MTVAVGDRGKGSPDHDDIGSYNGLAGGGIAHVTRDTSGFDDGEGYWREERADEQQDETNGIDRHGRSGWGVQERRSDLGERHSLSVPTFLRCGDARWFGPRDVGEMLRTIASCFAFLLSPQSFE